MSMKDQKKAKEIAEQRMQISPERCKILASDGVSVSV